MKTEPHLSFLEYLVGPRVSTEPCLPTFKGQDEGS